MKRLTQSLGDYWTTDTSWMDGWDMDNIDVDELMSRSSSIMQMTPCVEREREGGVCVCVCVCVCPLVSFSHPKKCWEQDCFCSDVAVKNQVHWRKSSTTGREKHKHAYTKRMWTFFCFSLFLFFCFFFFERAVFISDDMVEGSTNIELSR